MLAVGLVGYRLGSDDDSASTASAADSTANEQAANGPLVGDPTLISKEQKCVKDEPNEPWFSTIAAFEVHDSARTHLYACAHFLGSSSSENDVLAYRSTDVYQTPYNIVTRGPDNLYIYGGGYGDSSTASGWFVSSVEPGMLNERWRRVLINTNATDEWDYPGVLNVLRDGSLVLIYGYHIARLAAATGTIEASQALPTGKSAPRDSSYNGYDALPDGTIIAKTVNRQKGCTENGFYARRRSGGASRRGVRLRRWDERDDRGHVDHAVFLELGHARELDEVRLGAEDLAEDDLAAGLDGDGLDDDMLAVVSNADRPALGCGCPDGSSGQPTPTVCRSGSITTTTRSCSRG